MTRRTPDSPCMPRETDAFVAPRLLPMSVRRVMGTETEYGISVPGQPTANAMVASSQIVNAFQPSSAARERRTRWDFEEESPLRDARGFDLSREVATDAGEYVGR